MTESPIRTRKSPLMQSMIDAVRASIGPYDDETLIRTIGYCRTPEAAVKRCATTLDILPSDVVEGHVAVDGTLAVRKSLNDEAVLAEHLQSIAEGTPDAAYREYAEGSQDADEAAEAAPAKRTRPRATAGPRKRGGRKAQPVTEEKPCEWPGHQAAMDEHGLCPVCQ